MGIPCFEDGFGKRSRSNDPAGGEIETLVLCRNLAEAESTEPALVERAGQLAAFHHPAFAPVHRIERVPSPVPKLAVVSAAAPGVRLSEVLRDARNRSAAPNLDAARSIVAQATSAVADLHRHSRDLSHGAIGPERIVISPDGLAVIVEPVLALALERMQLARTPLWTEYRVPVPSVAGTARFDQLTDVLQLGVLALALVLGRPIRRDEYPLQLHQLMLEASAPDAPDDRGTASRALRGWIHRALQFEPRSAFRTAVDAAAALEVVLAEEPGENVSPAAVVSYVAACTGEAQSDLKVPAVGRAIVDASRTATVDAPRPAATRAPRTATVEAPRPETGDTMRRATADVQGQRPDIQTRRETVRRRAASPAGLNPPPASRVKPLLAGLAGALVLAAIFGVTFLGARGYLTLPRFGDARGTVVIESNPAGAEVFIDGRAAGKTPATLTLQAGEHTVVLRSGRNITLVPVVVVGGARRVERVEIRQHQPPPRPKPPRPPAALPPQGNPQ